MGRQLGLICALAALAWGLPAFGQPAATRKEEPPADRAVAEIPSDLPVSALAERLTSLSPSSPMDYFRLGEEVAAEIPAMGADPAPARRLAQHLYVLAYELERRAAKGAGEAAGRGEMGRSVCLALAAIEPAEVNQRWLWALARSFDPQSAGPAWAPIRVRATPDNLALDVGAVLGYTRAGEGRRAEALLARPGVSETLERYEGLLSPAGLSGGADSIRRTIAQWPICPECKNRRIVNKAGPGGGQTVLCHTCNGNPGPTLSADELLMQLRMESALLSGVQRSWAAQAVVDRGAPLRDLDPEELAPVFGVDVNLPGWREGKWVAEAAESAPAAPATVEEQAPEPGSQQPTGPRGDG